MFEFEDLSTGFHDILLNKYMDSSGPILDFYISDSMQDMLDIDIRSEVATVVGGTSEFSSLINDIPASLDLDITSNDGEISWLGGPKWSATTDIYADVGACVNPNSVMPLITTSLINSSKAHQVNLNTTTNPINNSRITNNSPPQSPKQNKSHLTFSPHQIKVPPVQENHNNKRPSPLVTTTSTISTAPIGKTINRNLAEMIKKDLSNDLMQEENNSSVRTSSSSNVTQNNVLSTNILSGPNTIKLAPGIGGLTFSNSLSYNKLKQSNNLRSSNIGANVVIKSEKESLPCTGNNHQQHNGVLNGLSLSNGNNTQNSNKTLSRSILVQNNKNFSSTTNINGGSNLPNHHHQPQQSHHHQNNSHIPSNTKQKLSKPVEHEYPKPAYSYSCLIAMALKNSRSGSLPVSEIYSFMCEHFPYFKTAPNGWKNSVRHNLSLNKCFEKIEKPVTNGGQRKGCLWAMNPAKISKMDEEVQKWSRKDPMAIRKAMVYPENLEALERGEMKHGSTGDSDNENDTQSDTEENSEDSEQEQDIDENLIETPESLVNEDEEGDEGTISGGDKEYEVEVTDCYDSIDLDDDKESVRMAIQQQNDLLASGGGGGTGEGDYSLSKRARLDVNYSFGPAGIFEQQQKINQQQQQQQQQPTAHHNRRKMQLVNRIA